MSNVPAGRVAGDEHPPKVCHSDEPLIRLLAHRLTLQPLDGCHAVLNGSGQTVLWGKAIIGCNNDRGQASGKVEAVILAIRPCPRPDAIPATMEVEKDRELAGDSSGCRWLVEAEGEVVVGVKLNIFVKNRTIIMNCGIEAWLSRPDYGTITIHEQHIPTILNLLW